MGGSWRAGRRPLGNGHISARTGDGVGIVYPSGLKVKSCCGVRSGGSHSHGVRGRILGFSRGAARRMREFLASVDWRAHPAHFVSLTYHEDPGRSAAIWKAHLKSFHERMKREYGGELLGVVWKEEFQARGVVHFHLAVFWRLWPPSEFADWVQRNWYEVVTGEKLGDKVGYLKTVAGCRVWYSILDGNYFQVRDGDFLEHGADVRALDTSHIGKFMNYCSKYLSKAGRLIDEETGELVATGRIWGTWGQVDALILARIAFDRSAIVELTRRLRKWGRHSRYTSKLNANWSGFLIWGDGWQLCGLLRGLDFSISPG